MTPEQNYRLLEEIEANRRFILMAYLQNPELLERAEERIRQIFDMPDHGEQPPRIPGRIAPMEKSP